MDVKSAACRVAGKVGQWVGRWVAERVERWVDERVGPLAD